MGTIAEKLQYLLQTKQDNFDALTDKGVDVPEDATFRDQADLIRSIETSDAVKLQNGRVTPDGNSTTLYPDYGYDGFSSVDVDGDDNLTSGNIRDGVTIYGVMGSYDGDGSGGGSGSGGGTIEDLNLKPITITPDGTSYTITAAEKECDGFSDISVNGDNNLNAENIKRGVSIYGVAGTLTPMSDTELPDACTVPHIFTRTTFIGGTVSEFLDVRTEILNYNVEAEQL